MESKEQVRSDVEILFNAPKKLALGLRDGGKLAIELREPSDAELDEYLDLFADAYKDIIMVFIKGQQNALKDSDIDITKIKKMFKRKLLKNQILCLESRFPAHPFRRT